MGSEKCKGSNADPAEFPEELVGSPHIPFPMIVPHAGSSVVKNRMNIFCIILNIVIHPEKLNRQLINGVVGFSLGEMSIHFFGEF